MTDEQRTTNAAIELLLARLFAHVARQDRLPALWLDDEQDALTKLFAQSITMTGPEEDVQALRSQAQALLESVLAGARHQLGVPPYGAPRPGLVILPADPPPGPSRDGTPLPGGPGDPA